MIPGAGSRRPHRPQARLLIVAALLCLAVPGACASGHGEEPLVVQDVSRLHSARVGAVVAHERVRELQAAVEEADRRGLRISIAGSRHSQGGHTFYPDALVLDMRAFDEILFIDTEGRRLGVQSGATWAAVQEALQPHGLAVRTMQSSNVFTVGGTLSANAHGRDLRRTQVIETVESFRLLRADGSIVTVSRAEHPELFGLVIGGYGLFGVILDVVLRVAPDEVLERRHRSLALEDLPTYIQDRVVTDTTASLMIARPSIAPSSLFEEVELTTWHRTEAEPPPGFFALQDERNVRRDRFFFDLSRRSRWGKELRWWLQRRIVEDAGEGQLISRNNAMRPPTAAIAFLDYRSTRRTDILQEYFVPTHALVSFAKAVRGIVVEERANLLSATIRWVTPNDEVVLAYAPRDNAFALVLLFNQELSDRGIERARRLTRRLVDAAIDHGGTYYLTYQLYPDDDQIRAAYPRLDAFFEKKRQYDPEERFMNQFYARYALGTGS